MKTLDDLIALVGAWIDRQDADGCTGCALTTTEETNE